ncbi:hypothetical protein IHQ68_04825 [Chelatococcus sambhunathii]|uniref:Uncharacterized protein n=1 Tax=Chelatococcus sambhunathii TaxID=363953 RepID=A0ABU1DCW3_9HYPH|nr:hypothetical protein [Chelatococcus sambhunathii]MDR4305948.1 hypothetical protein [Chelatococcus sambhunathii]
MGWRGQHNRELAEEEERRAWLASLTPAERWRIRLYRYVPLFAGAAIGLGLVLLIRWLLA